MYGGTITGRRRYTHDDAGGTSDSTTRTITITYSVTATPTKRHAALRRPPRLEPRPARLGRRPRRRHHQRRRRTTSGSPQTDGGSVGNRDNQIMSRRDPGAGEHRDQEGHDARRRRHRSAFTADRSASPRRLPITTTGGQGQTSFTKHRRRLPTPVTESLPGSAVVVRRASSASDPDSGTTTQRSDGERSTSSPGETVTCTYTNSRQPRLNVIKHVINDNGGTARRRVHAERRRHQPARSSRA